MNCSGQRLTPSWRSLCDGHPGIRVLELNNDKHTASSPRNHALSVARGKYITFLDADDMRMPEMDGLEATRRIRAMNRSDAKSVPVIALTANAFDEDVQNSMQAGLNAHLSKPVEPDILFETLEALLHN